MKETNPGSVVLRRILSKAHKYEELEMQAQTHSDQFVCDPALPPEDMHSFRIALPSFQGRCLSHLSLTKGLVLRLRELAGTGYGHK